MSLFEPGVGGLEFSHEASMSSMSKYLDRDTALVVETHHLEHLVPRRPRRGPRSAVPDLQSDESEALTSDR